MHKKKLFFAFAMSAMSCGSHLNASDAAKEYVPTVSRRQQEVVLHLLNQDKEALGALAMSVSTGIGVALEKGRVVGKKYVEQQITQCRADLERELDARIEAHVVSFHSAPAASTDSDVKSDVDRKRAGSASEALDSVTINSRLEALDQRIHKIEELGLDKVQRTNGGHVLGDLLNRTLFSKDGVALCGDKVAAVCSLLQIQMSDGDVKKAKSNRLDALAEHVQKMRSSLNDLKALADRVATLERAGNAAVVQNRSANSSPAFDRSSPAAPHAHDALGASHPAHASMAVNEDNSLLDVGNKRQFFEQAIAAQLQPQSAHGKPAQIKAPRPIAPAALSVSIPESSALAMDAKPVETSLTSLRSEVDTNDAPAAASAQLAPVSDAAQEAQ